MPGRARPDRVTGGPLTLSVTVRMLTEVVEAREYRRAADLIDTDQAALIQLLADQEVTAR